jgi:hypothetical protein
MAAWRNEMVMWRGRGRLRVKSIARSRRIAPPAQVHARTARSLTSRITLARVRLQAAAGAHLRAATHFSFARKYRGVAAAAAANVCTIRIFAFFSPLSVARREAVRASSGRITASGKRAGAQATRKA